MERLLQERVGAFCKVTTGKIITVQLQMKEAYFYWTMQNIISQPLHVLSCLDKMGLKSYYEDECLSNVQTECILSLQFGREFYKTKVLAIISLFLNCQSAAAYWWWQEIQHYIKEIHNTFSRWGAW